MWVAAISSPVLAPESRHEHGGTRMAHLDAYLFFDGTCAAAMRFYETLLDGTLEMMQTFAEAPGTESDSPQAGADRIMHARLNVDGRSLMASDYPADQKYPGMQGFAVS